MYGRFPFSQHFNKSPDLLGLLFSRPRHGDLTKYLGGYFDTTTGPKTDPESYGQIAAHFGLPASEIVFISDVTAELDAARLAGMETALCVAPRQSPPAGPRPEGSQSLHGHFLIAKPLTERDSSNLINLCCQDEVVLRQAIDLVSPYRDPSLPPPEIDIGMVATAPTRLTKSSAPLKSENLNSFST
jgi:hypothetical protein